MHLKTVKLNCLTPGSYKMSVFPKKVEYPFKTGVLIMKIQLSHHKNKLFYTIYEKKKSYFKL